MKSSQAMKQVSVGDVYISVTLTRHSSESARQHLARRRGTEFCFNFVSGAFNFLRKKKKERKEKGGSPMPEECTDAVQRT
jgi:hypothetical protein